MEEKNSINEWFDFFDTEMKEPEPIKMSKVEFLKKSQELLMNIYNGYWDSFNNKVLHESDFPGEEVCEGCTGEGCFLKDGEEKECLADHESGDCFYRDFDSEKIITVLENNFGIFDELLQIDEIID